MSPSNSTTNHGFRSAAVPVADPPSTALKTSSHTSSEHKNSSSEIAAQIPPSSSMGEETSGNSKELYVKAKEVGQQSDPSQKASEVPVQQSQQQQQQQQQKQQQYTTNPHNNGETTAAFGAAQVQQRPPSSASTSGSSAASFHTGTPSTAPGHHPYPHHHQQYQQYPNHHQQHHVQQQHHGPPATASAGYKMSHNEQMGSVPRGQGLQGNHYPPQHGGNHAHSNHYPHHNQPSGLVRPTGRYPVSHHGQGQQQGHGGQHGRPVTSRNSKPYQQQGQYPSHHYQQQQQHQYQAYHQAPGTGGGVATAISTRGMRNSLSPVPPGGSLSSNSNVNSSVTTTTHENPNYPSNNARSGGAPYHPKPQVPSQHAQNQQSHYPYDHQQQQVQGPPPSQDPRSEHHLPTMHQQGYHHNYGGQPMVQHDMHYNSYHHPAHGGPPAHTQGHPSGSVHTNHYRGHHNGGEYGSVSSGYPIGPGGHREVRAPHQHQHQSSHAHPSQPPPQPVHGFQLPKFNASSSRGSDPTVAVESRIPSESPPPGPPSPPPPPSAQALLRQKLREQETKKGKDQQYQQGENNHQGKIERERSVPLGSVNNNNNTSGVDSSVRKSIGSLTLNDTNKPSALGDRGNVVKTGVSSSTTPTSSSDCGVLKPEMIPEDPSMDAASILLALGGGPPPRGENQNACINPPIPSSVVQRSTSPDVSDAGTMLTMQTDAPDLTSDPSSDSIDMETNTGITQVVSKVPETEFPCRVPDRYPTRLSLPHDASKLNTLHCFLRSELLEIFCITKSNKKSPCHSPSSSVGRVGLRCVHCAMVRGSKRDDREDAPMAVFYPKSIAEIYRLVTSWQRCHLRKCRNVPPAARSRWQTLRDNDKSRGKTHYWVTSAKQIGLMDCQSRAGGIRFAPDFDARTLPAETMLTSSAEKSAAIAAKAQKIVSMAAAAEAEAASIQKGVSMDSSCTINTDSVPVANIAVEQIMAEAV